MASEAAVSAPAAIPPALEAPVPLEPAARTTPDARVDSPGKPAPVRDDAVPHIALLLPLDSKLFGRHAEAVRDGVIAALKAQGGAALPLREYAAGDTAEQALKSYIRAINAGARIVIGPLTRDGVAAIVGSAATLVPTLALNVAEGHAGALPENVYTLSLQIEAEARQVAQLAWQDGHRRAVTLAADTPLSRRIHQAFVDEYTRLGGAHASAYSFSPEPEALGRVRRAVEAGKPDMVFLALDFARARLARPYFGSLPVYATSQVNPGNAGPLAGFDLAGVRFLDMPWLLLPDHPAVMIYPRPSYREAVELERFYALGIDALRLALMLAAGRGEPALDGVTGRLTLGRDRHFARGLTPAQFADGRLTVPARERQ